MPSKDGTHDRVQRDYQHRVPGLCRNTVTELAATCRGPRPSPINARKCIDGAGVTVVGGLDRIQCDSAMTDRCSGPAIYVV